MDGASEKNGRQNFCCCCCGGLVGGCDCCSVVVERRNNINAKKENREETTNTHTKKIRLQLLLLLPLLCRIGYCLVWEKGGKKRDRDNKGVKKKKQRPATLGIVIVAWSFWGKCRKKTSCLLASQFLSGLKLSVAWV